MDKKAVVHLHNGILLGCKKTKILPFATAWMELEITVLSEISQLEKDKCSCLYVESKQQNNLTNKMETETRYIEQTDSC